jgi:transcription-repair coupling factor (superfamily II helicase)
LQQLGSGFDLAMRDLEIRGAGNLLGSQQSGHIAAVGYELYCRLLKMTVDRMTRDRKERLARDARAAEHLGIPAPARRERETVTALSEEGAEPLEAERPPVLAQVDPNDIRGAREGAAPGAAEGDGRGIPAPKVGDLAAAEEPGTDLEVGIRAFLPESYIPDMRMRLDAYRLLDSVRDRQSQESAAADLRDRFGRLPPEARRLLDIFLVKNRLRGSGVKLIVYSRDRYLVDYTDRAKADAAFARGFRDRRFVDEGRLHLVFDREHELPPDAAFAKLVKALEPAQPPASPPSRTPSAPPARPGSPRTPRMR